MDDWADKKALDIVTEFYKYHFDEDIWLTEVIAAALRDAAAESRRNAIEKSAELIGRQVEPRGENQ